MLAGLRGLNDESYSKCSGQKDCGAQISEVLANQTAWLEAAGQGNATKVRSQGPYAFSEQQH